MANVGEQRGPFYYMANAPLPWLALFFGVFFVLFFPVLILMAAPVFTPEPFGSRAFEIQWVNDFLLAGHIIFALPPLFLGPWLFHAQLRADRPRLHRLAGQVYVICCLLSAVTSLPLAMVNGAGLLPRIGFSTLAVVWFTTTYLGYHHARNRNFVAHRRWLMRSYACTFAFFNVKMYLLLGLARIDPLALKVMQSWTSWQLNMFVVEIYLASSTHLGKFVGWRNFRENITTFAALPRDFPFLQRENTA